MNNMVTLKQLREAVNAYILLHGDKEISSISSSSAKYGLNVCDIYDGPLGTNPYSGRDVIELYKDESSRDEERGLQDRALEKCLKLRQELDRMDDKPVHVKLQLLWTALDMLVQLGLFGEEKMKEVWLEFALEQLGLKPAAERTGHGD